MSIMRGLLDPLTQFHQLRNQAPCSARSLATWTPNRLLEAFAMIPINSESIALHIVRHLVRGLGKTEGQGISVQSLSHWWTVSLGQRSDDFKPGLEYAAKCRWIEHRPDNTIVLTSRGAEKGGTMR
jgi:hypothetical protein